MTMPGPLAGVRIVDMTTVLFGPYATMLLGELGADVIKVESFDGDSTRNTGPARHPGMAAVFLNSNRNKRSICVDLKRPEGREIVLGLTAQADVFVTNVRPKAVARLGLAYPAVKERNARIVYCSAVGYGQSGPYADYPAFDDTIQAMSGTAALQAEFAGVPQYVAGALADKSSGLMLALALLAAVRHAEKTGEGQEVEVPMFETMVSLNLVEHLFGRTFVPPLGEARYPRVVSKFRRPYKTLDGYLAVLPYNDMQWQRFFTAIDKPELMQEPRFATMAERTLNIDGLYELLADAIATRTSAEWLALLHKNDIPCVPVKTMTELVDTDEHLKQTGYFQQVDHPSEGKLISASTPIRMSKTHVGIHGHAPRLGQHSSQILEQLGYSAEEVATLMQQGVVRGENTQG